MKFVSLKTITSHDGTEIFFKEGSVYTGHTHDDLLWIIGEGNEEHYYSLKKSKCNFLKINNE